MDWAVTREVDAFYSPSRLDAILRRWPEYLALAETPRTARHLQTTECQPGHACSYGSPVGIRDAKGHHHDQLRYADIVADVEAARERLAYNSLGRIVVNYRMRRMGAKRRIETAEAVWEEESGNLDDIARALRVRYEIVRRAYRGALEEMAKSLGWRPP